MALWEESNYGIIADRACWSLFAVTSVVVGLRVICRLSLRQAPVGGLGLDDYITVFCTAIMLLTCILVTIGSHYGLGRHIETLEVEDRVQALKWNAIISSILIWSFSLPKFAIIAILKRILNYGLKTTILFWGLAISSQACILATSVWWYVQCKPVEYGWDRSIPGGTCAPVSTMANLGYFTSAYSAFLDLFFALYPIPFIMRLQMRLKARVAVSVALGMNGLACIVSIYKLAIFGQIFDILATDPTYPVPYLDILGVAEGAILLICASLPALGPLVRIARQNFTKANSSNGSATQSGRGVVGSSNWSSFKGHKIHDPEQDSTRVHSSVDDIPLVSAKKPSVYEETHVHGSVGSR